ncbi:MAG TPA: peptidylprolyl isomerase [Melioribacteraceae bacterium]|nr:peptidylprolyl isomerase [Melioribacteraceae bacterium]
MFYLKHLRLINKLIILFIFVFCGCAEKKTENKVVAQVNDSKLTEEELELFLGNNKNKNNTREEFIRDWIETEVLYLEAKEQGITDLNEYKTYLQNSQKELAVGLLIKRNFENYTENIQESDLIRYYNKNKLDFKLSCDSYLISLIKFNNITEAENFRLKVDETNWKSVVAEKIRLKKATIIVDDKMIEEYNIFPSIIKNYIEGMNENEISVVIKVSGNEAYIAKLYKKYFANDIPEFKDIRNTVEFRYSNERKQLAYKSFLTDLYSKYEITK